MHFSLQKFSALRAAMIGPVLCAALTSVLAAQNRPIVGRIGLPIFQKLTRNSGYIFAGTVISISKVESTPQGNVGTVKIVFHVEHAFRGVRPGQTLAIREWSGLWESGERYRVGERVMLFLFTPGKLGLTSPVGRELGRFQVDPYGYVLLNREHLTAISADPVLAGRWQGKTQISWKEFSRGIRGEIQDY
ncbi:MAG: hypothetical protein ACHP8A_06155 [Terriglobales bacterium]